MIPINLELLGFPISQSEPAICGRLCLSAAFFCLAGPNMDRISGKRALPLNLKPGSFLKSFPLDALAGFAWLLVPIDAMDGRFFSLKEENSSFRTSSDSRRTIDRGWRRLEKKTVDVWTRCLERVRGTLDRFVYFQRQSRFLIRWLPTTIDRDRRFCELSFPKEWVIFESLCVLWFSTSFPSSLLTSRRNTYTHAYIIFSLHFKRCVNIVFEKYYNIPIVREQRDYLLKSKEYLLNFTSNYRTFLSISHKLIIRNDIKNLDSCIKSPSPKTNLELYSKPWKILRLI